MTKEVVAIAVGLGGDAIRVVGDDDITVLFRQMSQCRCKPEQLISEAKKFVTHDR